MLVLQATREVAVLTHAPIHRDKQSLMLELKASMVTTFRCIAIPPFELSTYLTKKSFRLLLQSDLLMCNALL